MKYYIRETRKKCRTCKTTSLFPCNLPVASGDRCGEIVCHGIDCMMLHVKKNHPEEIQIVISMEQLFRGQEHSMIMVAEVSDSPHSNMYKVGYLTKVSDEEYEWVEISRHSSPPSSIKKALSLRSKSQMRDKIRIVLIDDMVVSGNIFRSEFIMKYIDLE